MILKKKKDYFKTSLGTIGDILTLCFWALCFVKWGKHGRIEWDSETNYIRASDTGWNTSKDTNWKIEKLTFISK